MLKGVLLDLDDTLYDYQICHTDAIKALCDFMYNQLGIDESKFYREYSHAKDTVKNTVGTKFASSHNRLLYCQIMLEHLGVKPFLLAPQMYDIYWDEFLSRMSLRRGAEEFLQYLRECKIKIGICTDMTAHIQFRKLQKLRVCDHIDALVTSEEAGAEKPDAQIFNLCLQKLELNPEECILVGDSIQKDAVGAESVGIVPILFRKAHNPITKYASFQSFEKLTVYMGQLLKEKNS